MSEPSPETIVQRPPAAPGAGSPPTIRQPEPGSPPTIDQAAPGSPPTVRQPEPGTGSGTDDARALFPEALLDRYRPVRKAGAGTEALVWEAVRRSDDLRVAVKVHWANRPVDFDLLAQLKGDPRLRRHVPEIYDFGELHTPAGIVGWVAMEFLPATLQDVIAAERRDGGGLPGHRVRELLAETAAAIRFWQEEVGRIPIDVKPDNFAVRGDGPAQVVISDFGGAVRDTATQRRGDVFAAAAYTAPEGLRGLRGPESPWWSLAGIVYEMLTGTARFRLDEDPDVILDRIGLGEVDLAAVRDPRWLRLLRGLYTREPADRWGAAEVEAWLAGEDPPVYRQEGPAPVQRANEPILFRGEPFDDPVSLARAMLAHSGEAAEWVVTGADALSRWLRDDLQDKNFATTLLFRPRMEEGAEIVLAFGATYAPDATPTFRGHPIDAAGVAGLGAAAAADLSLFDDLFSGYAMHFAARYRCGHAGCGERCEPLRRLADEVPQIVAAAGRRVGELAPSIRAAGGTARLDRGWDALSPHERCRAYVTAIELTLDPGRAPAVLGRWRWRRALWFGARGLGGPDWWVRLQTAAARAGARTVESRSLVAAVAALRTHGDAATARPAARRAVPWRPLLRSRLLGALLTFPALALAAWSGAVCEQIIPEWTGFLPREEFAEPGRRLGESAADRTAALLPALAVLALPAALLAGGRRRHVLTGAALLTLGLGYFASDVPAFPVGAPEEADRFLGAFGGFWGRTAGLAALAALAAVYGLTERAGTVLEPGPGTDASGLLPRLSHRTRRRVAGPVALAAFLGALWCAAVVRMTVGGAGPGDAVGAAAGRLQGDYLPLCVLAAAAVWYRARRPGGGADLAAAGAVCAALAGAWPDVLGHSRVAPYGVADGAFAALGGAWGAGAFWCALLLVLPGAVGAVLLLRERAT